MTEERPKLSDPAVMRALAHPARLVILEHLSLKDAGATATECAEVVGLSPSATSYHLRALAKVGLIEEAPSRGDGRERVWQRKNPNYALSGDLDATADDFAAQTALVEAVMAHQNDKVRRYLAAARERGDGEWYNAVTLADTTLVLTVTELTELVEKITELTRPYQRRVRKDPPRGSRNVSLQVRGVPLLSRDVK